MTWKSLGKKCPICVSFVVFFGSAFEAKNYLFLSKKGVMHSLFFVYERFESSNPWSPSEIVYKLMKSYKNWKISEFFLLFSGLI